MFKGITQTDFNDFFKSELVCRQYLWNLKNDKGFRCRRCNHDKFWKGRTALHLRCTACDYDESVTAHTIFHKLQIPLLKAFAMLYHIVAFKKGISTVELAKIYAVNQKTAWAFKRRIQDVMGIALSTQDGDFMIDRICKLDSIVVTHRSRETNGLQQVNLEIQKIENRNDEFDFVRCNHFLIPGEVDSCNLIAGRYIDLGKDIRIWNFKGWLTGVHHHCSGEYLKGYLDEFFFRLSFRGRQDQILHSVLCTIVFTKPRRVNARAA